MPDLPPRVDDHHLVSFANPPVEEVALAVQFTAPVVDLEVFAAFAAAVRDELPKREYLPGQPPMEETFDVPGPVPSFQINFDQTFALPRTWLISADETWLVQIQADRLAVNWRRLRPEGEYPRYGEVRERLGRFLDVLNEALAQAGAGQPAFNFCEITYVNPILTGEETPGATTHTHPAVFLRDIHPWADERFLPQPEDMQAQARWRILDEAQKPVGRLYLAVSPGFRPLDKLPIYMMNLTSRVIPPSQDREGVFEALDRGHRWVVLGFEDLTTPAMHEAWRKEGGS